MLLGHKLSLLASLAIEWDFFVIFKHCEMWIEEIPFWSSLTVWFIQPFQREKVGFFSSVLIRFAFCFLVSKTRARLEQ